MTNYKDCTLPYRATADDLKQVIEALARGRTLEQIQSSFPSSNIYSGALLTAYELGFVDRETNTLQQAGRDFLLGTDNRPHLLMQAVMKYEPYQLLFEAIFVRNKPTETKLEWIVNWWSTHHYGSSQSNREDGGSTLAKLLEYAGVGKFIIGRHGKPTRIEWSKDIGDLVSRYSDQTLNNLSQDTGNGDDAPILGKSNDFPAKETIAPLDKLTVDPEYSTLVLALGGGKNVQLRLPASLTADEKKRLLKLIGLLIDVEDDENAVEE